MLNRLRLQAPDFASLIDRRIENYSILCFIYLIFCRHPFKSLHIYLWWTNWLLLCDSTFTCPNDLPCPLFQKCFHLNDSGFWEEGHFWDKSLDLTTSLCCRPPKLSPLLAHSCDLCVNATSSSIAVFIMEILRLRGTKWFIIRAQAGDIAGWKPYLLPPTSQSFTFWYMNFTQFSSFKEMKAPTWFQFLCQFWMIPRDTIFKR